MQVTVKLHGMLRKHRPADAPGAPHHPFSLDVVPACTVHDVIVQLDIPDGFVNATAVNGEAVDSETSLNEGDQISFFPPSAGG